MSLKLVKKIPQFDLDILKPGVAIKYRYSPNSWINDRDSDIQFYEWYNAIIVKATPTRLTVTQYDKEEIVASGVLDLEVVLEHRLDIELLI